MLQAAIEMGVMNDNKGTFFRKGVARFFQFDRLLNFLFSGKTGNWKEHISAELNTQLDEWINENLRDTDLTYTLELQNQD